MVLVSFIYLSFLFLLFYSMYIVLGTPTSLLFTQEPDMSQLNVLKDCSNHALGHELVPVVSMNEQMMPEVLDNLPPPPPMQIQMIAVSQQSPMQMQMQQSPQPLQTTSQASMGLTGVYTLTEEPELEAEENTSM